MKRIISSLMLGCILSSAAFAGEIPMVGNATTPTNTAGTASASCPDDVLFVDPSLGISQVTLNLVQLMLCVGV